MPIVSLVRRVQLGIAMAALVVMMLVTVADVVMRYAFSRPIQGAYGLTETCLAVFVFHGISMTFVGRRNVVIDLVDGILRSSLVRILVRVADVATVVVLGIVGWSMIDPALQAFEYGDVKPELGLPLSYIWAAAIIGIVGTLISALGELFVPATPERAHGHGGDAGTGRTA